MRRKILFAVCITVLLLSTIFTFASPSTSTNFDGTTSYPPFYGVITIMDRYTEENLFRMEIEVLGKWWLTQIRSNDEYTLAYTLKDLREGPLENISFSIGLLDQQENLVWSHEFQVDNTESIHGGEITLESLPQGKYNFIFSHTGYYPKKLENPLFIVEPPLPYVKEWIREINLGLSDVVIEEFITVNNSSSEPIVGIDFVYSLTDNIWPFAWVDPSTSPGSSEVRTENGKARIQILLDQIIEAEESKKVFLKYRISNFVNYPQEKYPFDEKTIHTLLPWPRELILENRDRVNISRVEHFSQLVNLPKGLQVGDFPPIEAGETISYYSEVRDVFQLTISGLIRYPSSDLWESETLSLSTHNINNHKNLPLMEERALIHKVVFFLILSYAVSVILFSIWHIILKKKRKSSGIFSYYMGHFGFLFLFYIGSNLILPRPNVVTLFEKTIFISIIAFAGFGFIEGIMPKIKRKDLFLVASCIPLSLFLIFLLPNFVKSQLILILKTPQALSLFTTQFVHVEISHLLSNVFLYVILIFPIYLLNSLANQRKKFYLMLFLIFIPLPLLLSTTTLALMPAEKISRSFGFSGIVAALVGFLPYSIFNFLKKSYKWEANIISFMLVTFFFSAGIVALTYFEPTFSNLLILTIIWGLFFGLFIKILKDASLRACLSSLQHALVTSRLVGGSALIYLFSLFLLFPEKLRVGRAITNISAHWVGFIFGFWISLFFFVYLTRQGRPSKAA